MASCRPSNNMGHFSKKLLIFQPDARTFCPKGKSCDRQDDEVHAALYDHSERPKKRRNETELLNYRYVTSTGSDSKSDDKSSSKSDSKSYSEVKPEKNATRKTVSISRVPKAWEVAKHANYDGLPEGRTIIFFVHGFRESYLRFLICFCCCCFYVYGPIFSSGVALTCVSGRKTHRRATKHGYYYKITFFLNFWIKIWRYRKFPRKKKINKQTLTKTQRVVSYLTHLSNKWKKFGFDGIKENEKRPCVFAFTWPSQTVPTSYVRARLDTLKAARKLRKVLYLLRRRRNKIILIGHSMGGRVVCNCLYNWEEDNRNDKEQEKIVPLVQHAILAAPAIASDSFEEEFGKFPASKISCDRITVLSSKKDLMLKNGFFFGELIPGVLKLRPSQSSFALGVSGVTKRTLKESESTNKIQSFDLTEEIPGHSIHFYFNSSTTIYLVLSVFHQLAWGSNQNTYGDLEKQIVGNIQSML